jgi:shikimate dehydrogenase
MRVLATVGFPATQVKLPALMNTVMAQEGIDVQWVALEVMPETITETVQRLLAIRNFVGLSITIPFKRTLFPLCDIVSTAARVSQAINVLKTAPDGRTIGDMFDGSGFVAHLSAAWREPAGRSFALLGAGGAGIAIGEALLSGGAKQVTYFDANSNQAVATASRLAEFYPGRVAAVASDAELRADVLVNCSPIGMLGNTALPIAAEALHRFAYIADIVMEPEMTPLLVAAEGLGLPYLSGRGMLAAQVASYRSFFGL